MGEIFSFEIRTIFLVFPHFPSNFFASCFAFLLKCFFLGGGVICIPPLFVCLSMCACYAEMAEMQSFF